jgi:biopolymer transport protein ExbB/TolQ
MIRLFTMGGPYMPLLTLLAIVILALAAKKATDLFARTGLERDRLTRGVDAILFWGVISAVLGFLGQFTAMYKSLMIIRGAGLIDPSRVAEGIAVSLITTIYGLAILAVSALLWFGLRSRVNGLVARKEEAAGV